MARCRAQIAKRISTLADSGWNTYVTDAQRGYAVVLIAGPLAALVLCLFYMLLLRFFAGFFAWSVVVLINLLFAALTLLCAYKSALLGSVPGLSRINEIIADAGGETVDGALPLSVSKILLFLFSLGRSALARVSAAFCLHSKSASTEFRKHARLSSQQPVPADSLRLRPV
jgi:hypothetical protein